MLVPEVIKLVKLTLVMPDTNAVSEWSLSTLLKELKLILAQQ